MGDDNRYSFAGSALTTFNKGHVDLSPTIIAHRSSYTRGELLINPTAFKSFKNKVKIHDQVQFPVPVSLIPFPGSSSLSIVQGRSADMVVGSQESPPCSQYSTLTSYLEVCILEAQGRYT